MRRLLRGAFDGVFQPLATVNPICALIVFSMLSGLLVSVVFRYAANRDAIRNAKNQMQAGLLGVRLFQDQLDVSLGCYASLFGGALRYLRSALIPAAIGLIPLTIIFCQLQMRMEWSPPRAGDTFLVTARVRDAAGLQSLSLELPKALTMTAPPVRVAERREITWRIRTDEPGSFTANIRWPNGSGAKTIVAGQGFKLLSPIRSTSLMRSVLYLDETRLPSDGPLEEIDVGYDPRETEWNWRHPGWETLYFVFTFIAAFAFKPLTGAEI